MAPSDLCIELICKCEGYRNTAYPDPATGGKPWTIGYGTTKINGSPVMQGMTCTVTQARNWMLEELNEKCIPAIKELVHVELSQYQVDALCSFIYNCGAGNFEHSTLLKKINLKDFKGAADEFLRWNKAAGKTMPGLTRRRILERELFLKEREYGL